jgi:hypothetical protein
VRHPDGTLFFLAGDGAGGFAAPVKVPGSFTAYDVVSGGGDFTADGNDDLMVRSRSTGATYILPGRGDGTFDARLGPLTSLAHVSAPAVAALGGSRAADVVAIDGGKVVGWVNPGSFDLGRPIDTGRSFAGANAILAVGDWDRDGEGDVVERQTATGNLYLLRGNGTGHLGKPVLLATGFGSVRHLAAVGDVTGDGYPDLMGQPRGGVLRIYPGNGPAGLKKSYPAYGAVTGSQLLGVGRWNADGAPDVLLRQQGALTLFSGNGPGGLYRPTRLGVDVSRYDWVVGVSSLTGSGHPDLLVRKRNTGKLYELPGSATGIGAPVYLGEGLQGYDLVG